MGNNIKKIRNMKVIVQAELASAIGISRQYLSDIENQKKQPTIKVAFDCAKYLCVSMEELFFYKDVSNA